MRKGITLVEILLAIALFAVLSSIAYKSANSALDTRKASAKAQSAYIIEVGNALSSAYDVYKAENGYRITALTDLTNNNYVAQPTVPDGLSGAWTLAGDINITDGNGTNSDYGQGFELALTFLKAKAGQQFCSTYNQLANGGLAGGGNTDYNTSTSDLSVKNLQTATYPYWAKDATGSALDNGEQLAGTVCSTTNGTSVTIAFLKENVQD